MGCNCNKGNISLRAKLRKEAKEKIADIKKIWKESSNKGNALITKNKNELGFK